MYSPFRFVLVALVLAAFLSSAFAEEINRDAMKNKKDLPGSKDHPMITRVPDSWIVQYEAKEFDEVMLLLGPATDNGKYEKSEVVQGKVTRIAYAFPDNRSTLEVIQGYLSALKREKFQTLYTCNTERECGNSFTSNLEQLPGENSVCYFYGCDEDTIRYAATRLARPEGDIYVVLTAFVPVAHSQTPIGLVRIVEVKPMEDLVSVNWQAMAKNIHTEGHIALYGIYFDFNKADLKPESEPALQQIAKLLAEDPSLKLFVVGHTDSDGTLPYNMDLSQRRSDAVVKALVSKHGIDGKRLGGKGVGPLAPVATNDSEDGRAKNRRVELVKQ